MESEKQARSGGGAPGRPPPPHYPSAPPPYYDPQSMYPTAPAPGGPYYPPPPPSYPEAYQMGFPPPTHPGAPPVYPGGHSMYPDVSQLPQPEAGNVFFAGDAYRSTKPRQSSLYNGQPYGSTGPRQLHGGQPNPSTQPYYNHGAPYPNTGHHQYGLYGDVPARARCHVGPGYGGDPMYGLEAPRTFPIEPPLYDANSTFLTSTSTGYSSQAHHPSACPPAYADGTPASSTSPVPLGFVTVNQGSPGALTPGTLSTGPLSPVRPAPPPPDQNPGAQNFVNPSLLRPGQHPSSAPLKDGQPPPGCVVSWRGGEGLQVFFMQSEGHIVSPKKPLVMSVYKRIGGTHEGDENLLGMIEVHGCCRLKFTTKISFALHSSGKSYIFLDNSTCPERIVVLLLPSNVSKTMQADLLSLINELTDLREEQESMVGKITTGVGTVYTDLTKKLNTVVKETVPGAHKSTKWLRKGTGSLVRMSGNVVSKGMHVIADHIPANEQPKEESPVHTQLLTALRHFKNCKEEDSITYV